VQPDRKDHRRVEAAESLAGTRDGTPVAELRPCGGGRRRFALWTEFAAAMATSPPIGEVAFRRVGVMAARVRSHRSRIADLMNAAVAHANALPRYVRNTRDVDGLTNLITVHPV